MQLFYNISITTQTTQYVFPKEESKHIVRVLRKSVGDSILITNGKGQLFKGVIAAANPNKCLVKTALKETQPPIPYRLHMAVAPTKLNDRFEWFLEKATEIGITEITPILCHHSERKTIKLERYEKIIQSAMKQSLRYHLPKLNELTPISEILKSAKESNKTIAHCESGTKMKLKDWVIPNQDILILIGPEGDFSTQEIATALEHNFTAISLGDARLRTETAAIAACHTVALMQ